MNGPQATAAASDATATILVAKSTSAQKPSDGKPALRDVDDEDECRRGFSRIAQDVGRSGRAAAYLAQVDAFQRLDGPISRRDGAEPVTEDDEQYGVHLLAIGRSASPS